MPELLRMKQYDMAGLISNHLWNSIHLENLLKKQHSGAKCDYNLPRAELDQQTQEMPLKGLTFL